jgi:uncharacterized protein (DUF58 family)
MIVPQYRLIFWTGSVALPLSLIIAFEHPAIIPGCVIGGVFILMAAADAVLAFGRLDGISASFPEIARVSKDREGKIDIEIENARPAGKRLRLGIMLPAEIASPHQEMATVLPAGTGRSCISWPCTGLRRGRYVIENIYLETDSPLGFWATRKVWPALGEVRVYPNTIPEQKNLAALFLNRGLVGMHAQRQVGKGREFEKLREYIPGDSYDDIHWKATAKRGRPITKVFQIERTQELYVVVDASRLSARELDESTRGDSDRPGNARTTQLERFITAAMVLGMVAEKQGDMFGLMAFDDQVKAFVRAKRGKAHYSTCREAFYTIQPRMTNPDFSEVFSFIRLHLRRRALLIFLTDLSDPVLSESFARNLDVISRHHLTLVAMLTDPGTGQIFSDADASSTDEIYRRLGGHIQWHNLKELERVLKRRGVSMRLLENELMCSRLVSEYINIKRRQIL